ncbi:hypothetical protein B0H14DRAFT_2710312 [Mycena olivaceomarginata]|nr:hypothetical protein B0H14DRAFT_2710312 [Mycena olivaceomarginata]
MRALIASPLNDDIVYLIMTFCPTFASLLDMMLVSKAFYRVYQTQPKSVTQAALRVVQYPYPACRSARDEEGLNLAAACPEEDISSGGITAEEQEKLQENAGVVQELEDIYSLTQKDRTSKTSVLTPAESLRFQRATYRIMFYCKLFCGDVDDREEDVQLIRRQRTAVLSEYPTDELLQLYAVVDFMRDILEKVCAQDYNQSGLVDLLLSAGPYGVWRVWEDRSYEGIGDDLDFGRLDEDEDDRLYEGYFSLALASIWAARQVPPPNGDDGSPTKWILDTIIGADDTCSHCAAPGGFSLLTEANWHRLRLSAWPTEFLKGELNITKVVTRPFEAAIRHMEDPWHDWGVFFSCIKASSPSEWSGWERDQSYCERCFSKFLKEYTWQWFLEERVKDGWVPPENCGFGYNCKTMVEDDEHAEAKNHLCVPSKTKFIHTDTSSR